MGFHGTACGLFVAILGVACSSSESDGNKNGAANGGTGSSAGGTDGVLNVGGQGGDPTPISITADGGVDALRNASCAGNIARTEPLPVVIELVVDTSGSMGQAAPGGTASKWAVTRDALKAAMNTLPASTGVGVLYFPNLNTSASKPAGDETDAPRPVTDCVNTAGALPIALLGAANSPERTAIASSLDKLRPAAGTPTADAYGIGLAAIQATTLPGKRFIVLITDGQPTFLSGCRGTGNIVDAVDPRPIIDLVKGAMSGGVETFLIGSPGSEQVGVPVFADARTWLSMAASAGGTATPGCSDNGPTFCHFDMSQKPNFAEALRGALQQIVGSVLSCEYTLPAPPSGTTLDPSKVNVIFTAEGAKPELIEKSPDGSCATGWQYAPDGAHVDLCPDTCNRVQGAQNPQVDLLFGCSSTVAQPR
jgi:hypothetical protein